MPKRDEPEQLTLLRDVQRGLTAAKAMLSELERQLLELNLPGPVRYECECGVTFKSQPQLDEHRYLTHDGPEPPAWLAAEAASAT